MVSDYDLESLYTENRDNIQKKLSYQVLEGLNDQILIEDNVEEDSSFFHRLGMENYIWTEEERDSISTMLDSIAYERKVRDKMTSLMLAGVNQNLNRDDSVIQLKRRSFFESMPDSVIFNVSKFILNDNIDLRQAMDSAMYRQIMPEIKKEILIDSLIDLNKEQQYIIFGDLFITNIKLPEEVSQIIEDKIIAEQEFLTYQYKLDKERSEAERKRIEATGIQVFERVSAISILKWRGLEATEKLARSPNSKLIILGTDENLPIILNGEVPDTTRTRNQNE